MKKKETEIKRMLSEKGYWKLLRYLEHTKGTENIIVKKDTYFDTIDYALYDAGYSLRLREYLTQNRELILKQRKNQLSSIEYVEDYQAGVIEGWNHDSDITKILNKITTKVISPTVALTTLRTVYNLSGGQVMIDKVAYRGGIIDYEVEYEYTKGVDSNEFLNMLRQLDLDNGVQATSKHLRAIEYMKRVIK